MPYRFGRNCEALWRHEHGLAFNNDHLLLDFHGIWQRVLDSQQFLRCFTDQRGHHYFFLWVSRVDNEILNEQKGTTLKKMN